ncbi:MAG TPA: sulfate ABC transporter substrate-binding protein [Gaiellaceae bacterium]|nr:sulfate ABC transporter substrate-binding protein [Gaiellaceae bacterium]
MIRRIALLLVLAGALAASCAAAARSSGTTLNLVAYSTPKPVMSVLIGAYQKTAAGKGVSFTQSYGPSGAQARAIAAGQPADIAFLSTGLDVDTLVDAGLVAANWGHLPYGGIAADSQVVFVVRPGNPKHIGTWSDLIKPGVQVVTPNPFSSGSAKWNILAAYGAMRKAGKTDKQAVGYLKQLFQHVVSQDSSGANAMTTFLSGKGDVVITYESEAIAARETGANIQFVVPNPTMLIQLPMVPLKSSPNYAKATQFIQWLHTTAAQEMLARGGYQPVEKAALQRYRSKFLPKGRMLFRITDKLFGGWRQANKTWFDPNTGRMVAIERSVGGPGG